MDKGDPVDRAIARNEFLRTCMEHIPDPEKLERIANIFLETAAEMRALKFREAHHVN